MVGLATRQVVVNDAPFAVAPPRPCPPSLHVDPPVAFHSADAEEFFFANGVRPAFPCNGNTVSLSDGAAADEAAPAIFEKAAAGGVSEEPGVNGFTSSGDERPETAEGTAPGSPGGVSTV